ncbi:DUF6571 family protein [Streptomyces sp. NPDC052079]|uniref:DUF6571 family protein n=1 Tax=Streptomyces sp. NPDC052079 TaxID=3155526 RepID=UPI0034387501
MPTFENLLNARLGSLSDAVDDWTETVKKLEKLEEQASKGMLKKAGKADWEGENAGVTLPFVRKTAKEFGDALKEAESIRNILRGALTEFKAAKAQLSKVVEDAPGKGIRVDPDGTVSYQIHPDRRGKDYAGPEPKEADFEQVRTDITEALKRANEADEVASRALRTLVGKDKHNFSGTEYTSLSDADKAQQVADAKEFVAISRKGADASPTELARANNLLQEHSRDRLFAERVATGMGAKGTMTFWAGVVDSHQGNLPKNEASTLKNLQKNLSLTLAAASHSKTPQMQQWKRDIITLGDQQFIVDRTKDTTGPYGFQITSSLLREGKFDTDFLNDYGKKLYNFEKNNNAPELWSNGGSYYDALNFGAAKNDDGKDPMTGFLEALGHNPNASEKFFHDKDHFNYLTGVETKNGPEPRIWPQDSANFVSHPDQTKELPGFDSLGHALEAATTGHSYETGPSPATSVHSKEQAEIMSRIVGTMSEHPELMREGMGDSLGRISAEYMSDIHRAVDANPSHLDLLFPNNGVDSGLGERDVTRFLHRVGQDPDGYAAINLGQHQYTTSILDFHAQKPDIYANGLSGDHHDGMRQVVQSISTDAGEIEGIIGAGRDYAVEEGKVKDDEEFNKSLQKSATWVGGLVGIGIGIGVSPFVGPTGIVAGGLLGTATGDILNGVVSGGQRDGLPDQIYRNGHDWEALKKDTVYTTQQAINATELKNSTDVGLYSSTAATGVDIGFGAARHGVGKYIGGEASNTHKGN